jgi:YfiH family protein
MRFSNPVQSNAFPDGAPLPSNWMLPQWPAPANVHSLCTTRAGGSSQPPFDGFNLGLHVGDNDADVLSNRTLLQSTIGARPVFMQQVHGSSVLLINPQTPDGLQADGSFTRQTEVACTMMVADCLPMLLCDDQGTQVAAVHAGWRGLAGQRGHGVLEAARGVFECPPENLMVWLGPCIGPSAFEVGEDVRAAFIAVWPGSASAFEALGQGKWLADLPALARQRLSALGITQVYGNDSSKAWCTVNQPSRFFSYRRDRVCGRFAACIWLSGSGLA